MICSLLVLYFIQLQTINAESLCTSKVFCGGQLLHTVQMSRIFSDSKTFVDMKMIYDEKTTLENFEDLLKNTNDHPSRKRIKMFVADHFEMYPEIRKWNPPDFTDSPEILQRIDNREIRNFTQDLVNIWPKLARKTSDEVLKSPHLFTLVPMGSGFIVPGGRFREIYYWDSYWIIEGLLRSEMYETVRGILDNFISLVERFGLVPNGSRIYYLSRTQPPLLTLMVASYLRATNDTDWLRNNIRFLEAELHFFLRNRVTEIVKYDTKYHLAHYKSNDETPRPESYYEDVKTSIPLYSNTRKRKLFGNLRSAAESGWDFSSRWHFDMYGGTNANLTYTQTSRVIPVDLNAILCQAFRLMSEFFVVLDEHERAIFWLEKADTWQKSVEAVFYHKEDGIWYDWDNVYNQPRRLFYVSNFAPLWTGCYNLAASDELGKRAAEYLGGKGILEYDGGVPASLIESGEQWDYPNAWPPLQSMVIFGLDQTGNELAQATAETLAKDWVESNMVSFYRTNQMFEKYNVQNVGESGLGGEYEIQTGFGWTNGVLFQLIDRYYTRPKEKR